MSGVCGMHEKIEKYNISVSKLQENRPFRGQYCQISKIQKGDKKYILNFSAEISQKAKPKKEMG